MICDDVGKDGGLNLKTSNKFESSASFIVVESSYVKGMLLLLLMIKSFNKYLEV